MKKKKENSCCSQKPSIESCSLISLEQASELKNLFSIFANENRLRLLHALILAGKIRVTDLAERVEMSPQAVSNQLQRLLDKGIVGLSREGNSSYYFVTDPCVAKLLDPALCLLEEKNI